MSEPAELALFPVWRQAVRDFLAEFNYGDTVGLEWLEKHFNLLTLDDKERLTAAAFRARQFAWLSHIEAFKRELLVEHQVCLESVRGEGYRWVTPQEQTGVAMKEFERDAKRAFRGAGLRLSHIRVDELSDAQRAENLDAVAKVAMLRGMTRKQLR